MSVSAQAVDIGESAISPTSHDELLRRFAVVVVVPLLVERLAATVRPQMSDESRGEDDNCVTREELAA